MFVEVDILERAVLRDEIIWTISTDNIYLIFHVGSHRVGDEPLIVENQRWIVKRGRRERQINLIPVGIKLTPKDRPPTLVQSIEVLVLLL